MHLSRLGSAAYGTVTVAVDGAIPAALSGQVAGAQFGPSWLDSDGPRIAYQSGGTGSGPWILQSYNVTTLATATLSASGQNFMAAGGGHWLAYLAGSGVRSDVTIASPNAPLAGAFALNVSPDGELVICDYQNTGTGLSVYNSSGTSIFHLATVVLSASPVYLVDDILSFQSVNTYTYNGVTYGPGWHLINIATGAVPTWLPRIDGVNWLIPCTDTDGTLFLVERAESVSIREAARSTGYTLTGSTGLGFNPDGIPYTAGVIRAGFCTDLGESVSSVVLWDVTMATGAASKGVVSGGTIVFSAQPTLEAVQFTVGPAEGSGTTTIPAPPIDHAVTKFIPSPQAGQSVQRMTQEWQAWAQRLRGGVLAVANTASKSVTPTPLQTPAFGVIAGDVTPSIVATTAGDTLSLTSADGSILFASNPATKTLDLAASVRVPPSVPVPRRPDSVTRIIQVGSPTSGTVGPYLVPLSLGVEPLTFVSDGGGRAIFVWFQP